MPCQDGKLKLIGKPNKMKVFKTKMENTKEYGPKDDINFLLKAQGSFSLRERNLVNLVNYISAGLINLAFITLINYNSNILLITNPYIKQNRIAKQIQKVILTEKK